MHYVLADVDTAAGRAWGLALLRQRRGERRLNNPPVIPTRKVVRRVDFRTMNQTVDAEQAIRTYLLSLQDPGSLVDTGRIAELETAARDATDPIARLKALAALSRARVPDLSSFEQGFVRHARSWAESNDIPPSTFREMGVSDAVLRSAGLSGKKMRSTPARVQERGKSVSAREISDAILRQMASVFTLADVATKIGGSPMTIRKAVDELVQAGHVQKLGPTPGWAGRGRAPLQFSK